MEKKTKTKTNNNRCNTGCNRIRSGVYFLLYILGIFMIIYELNLFNLRENKENPFSKSFNRADYAVVEDAFIPPPPLLRLSCSTNNQVKELPSKDYLSFEELSNLNTQSQVVVVVTNSCREEEEEEEEEKRKGFAGSNKLKLTEIVNNNIPLFDISLYPTNSFETYPELDELGRVGECVAVVGLDIMPKEKRKDISSVLPSGWHQVMLNNQAVFNRCHMIGFQLTGENANPRNLFTGTRALNVLGMLPFENAIAQYVKTTGNPVLYRVTPKYENKNDLIPSGVFLEAQSFANTNLRFCVFCFNVQKNVDINYQDGFSIIKLDSREYKNIKTK